MKNIIILLNIISLLSIAFALAKGVSFVGTGASMTIHIPTPQAITIKTPIVIIVTLLLDLYWVSKRC